MHQWSSDKTRKLTLPEPNLLIPKNFDIKPRDDRYNTVPGLIKVWDDDLGGGELWLWKDDEFRRPVASIILNIFSSNMDYGKTVHAANFMNVLS